MVALDALMELGHCKRRHHIRRDILPLSLKLFLALLLQGFDLLLLQLRFLLLIAYIILLSNISINITVILRLIINALCFLEQGGLRHQAVLRLCKT